MQPPKKTYRLPRVQRNNRIELPDSGEGQGWAVSYSDLLMVLLGFFVLFFSYSEKKDETRDSIRSMVKKFDQVTTAAQPTPTVQASPTPAAVEVVAQPAPLPRLNKRIEEALSLRLSPSQVRPEIEGDLLTLRFSLSAYKPGEFLPDSKLQEQLNTVAEILRPHLQEVEVTVVGHTDTVPVGRARRKYSDNFELSLQRSMSAVRHLNQNGLPMGILRAEGASEFDALGRSISLKLRFKDSERSPAAEPTTPPVAPTPAPSPVGPSSQLEPSSEPEAHAASVPTYRSAEIYPQEYGPPAPLEAVWQGPLPLAKQEATR